MFIKMKTKKLDFLSLESKMISNLSSQSIVGGSTSGCSYNQICDPTTDAGGGASCTCTGDA